MGHAHASVYSPHRARVRSSVPLEPPFYLGPYKVVDQIGAGGFATVFKAVVEGEMGFQRTVALKVLHGHVTRDDPEIVKMLADEARLMSRMQHPNIVYVQWFGQLDHPQDGRVFGMLMELVQGRSLRSLLEEARNLGDALPTSVVLDLYLDIARALAFAHNLHDDDGHPLGLVHRDLKPDNVMISSQGIVKLLDFGIAKATGRLAQKTATDLVRGTVQYMSPEQIKGAKDLDFRSDLFSFGAMLWEALTNRRLITADTVVAAIHQVASFSSDEALSAIAKGPPGLTALLARLLDPDRNNRFDSTDAVVDALQTIRGQVPAERPTAVYLREHVSPTGKTAAVRTPSGPSSRGTEDTELVRSAGASRVRSNPPTLDETETIDSGSVGLSAPFDATRSIPPSPALFPPGSIPPPSPPDPVPPTRLVPSPAHAAPGEPPRRSMAAWIAVPILVAVGVVIGGVGLRALDAPPDPTPLAVASDAPEPVAEPTPVAVDTPAEPLGDRMAREIQAKVGMKTGERPLGDRRAEGIQADIEAAMEEANAEIGAAFREMNAGTDAALAASKALVPASITPTPKATPAPTPVEVGPPGRLRLSADHPFEVVVDGRTWTARDARRGIELPAGTWPVTVRCLQCPPGVTPSLQQSIEVPSGGTSTQVLKFPEAG
jgi:eukaryotic-like serine/threonine-protein kinase